MRLFSRSSIQARLSMQLFALVLFILMATTSAFVVTDVILIRQRITAQLTTLADIIGENSAVGLNYLDPEAVGIVLTSLRREESIVQACVYDDSNAKFAWYVAQDIDAVPLPPPGTGIQFRDDGFIDLFVPIEQEDSRLGTVYLRASTSVLESQYQAYAVIVGTVILACLAIALLAASRIQRWISDPILHLADATRQVSETRDYSLRLDRPSDDELGTLYSGFNSMLVQIAERDRQLLEAHDVLELRVEERTDELARRNAELRRSNEELQQFAYVSSHDLQEPLRKIQAFGKILQDEFAEQLGDEGNDYLERMHHAATRMRTLIEDLLAYSRVASRARPFERLDVTRITREVLTDLEGRLLETKGVVNLEELPQLDADPTQLRQLLQNLIGNALKYRDADRIPVVNVRAEILRDRKDLVMPGADSSEVWQLTVQDNGIGFDEKYLDRIFAPFQRLHGRNSLFKGTGMGLAVCRKIVDRHGGQITARSTPGDGTTFLVTLPRNQQTEELPNDA